MGILVVWVQTTCSDSYVLKEETFKRFKRILLSEMKLSKDNELGGESLSGRCYSSMASDATEFDKMVVVQSLETVRIPGEDDSDALIQHKFKEYEVSGVSK